MNGNYGNGGYGVAAIVVLILRKIVMNALIGIVVKWVTGNKKVLVVLVLGLAAGIFGADVVKEYAVAACEYGMEDFSNE